MKKKLIAFVFALVLILPAVSASAASSRRVYDEANIFTDDQEAQLEKYIERIRDTYGLDAAIVTVNSLSGYSSIDYFSEDFFDKHGFGAGEDRDGIELVLKMSGGAGNRDYYVDGHGSRGRYAESHFNDDSFVNALRSNDFYRGALRFLEEAERRAQAATPVGRVKSLLPVFLIAGALIALITVLILRGKMKTAKSRDNAADYAVNNSFRLTRSLDMYLYTSTTRTRIESSSSSGGHSGGGHSGGGHSGHGGKF